MWVYLGYDILLVYNFHYWLSMMEINHYTDSRMNIYTQFMTTAFGAGMGIKQGVRVYFHTCAIASPHSQRMDAIYNLVGVAVAVIILQSIYLASMYSLQECALGVDVKKGELGELSFL